MKLLIFWDIYGRIWRNAFLKELPILKEKYSPDFVITNVDNLTAGKWAIEKHILVLKEAWVDIMTAWDHIFDNFDKVKDYIFKQDSNLLTFANFYDDKLASYGEKIFEKGNWKLLVIHLQGEIFMNHKVNNPFSVVEKILEKYKNDKLDWIIIDFHKEASSEFYWLANYLDGKISFIFGTHTHVQTNDDVIFPNWTGIISDVGMTWPLYSVIWADFETVKGRFLYWINRWKIEQSLSKEYVVSWVFVEIWKKWKCEKIEKIRIIEK